MQRAALITGVSGQDGVYLSQLLLERGYKVHGTITATSDIFGLKQFGISDQITLHELDLADAPSIYDLIEAVKPDEFYNLAGRSSVGQSWKDPVQYAQVNAVSVTHILEAIRKFVPQCRFYQASTSELFGNASEVPQKEDTPFNPTNPYGVSKLYAHCTAVNYRNSYDMFTSCGILFNHESPLREEKYVSRKITSSLVKIKLGLMSSFELGNMNAKRDWGFAGDYVDGMWRMLQQDKADDYILATGIATSVRDFVDCAAQSLDMEIIWQGEGLNEVGIDAKTNDVIVSVNKEYFRPIDMSVTLGCPNKAKTELGWVNKVGIKALAKMMVRSDFDLLSV